MNGFEQHPHPEVLDRLRAGMFDDDPQQRLLLEQHLSHCPACREAFSWPDQLGTFGEIDERQLDRLRHEALRARAPASRRWLPAAAAAAVLLAVFALANLGHSPPPPAPRVAASDATVPDLYEDLDFYLWLADHKGKRDSST